MAKKIIGIRVDRVGDTRVIRYLAKNHSGQRYVLKASVLPDAGMDRESRRGLMSEEILKNIPAKTRAS